MSRCFPFPPHGYSRSGVTGNALIESIKFPSGKVNPHSERKEEYKKERKPHKEQKHSYFDGDRSKEQKKGRKNHRREQKYSSVDGVRSVGPKFANDQWKKFVRESIDGYLEKVKDETEQLERSGITEEYENPVSSRDLGYLSDSSQHSKRRKRESSLSIEKGSENGGTVIRIRLRKLEEPKPICNEHIDRTVREAPSVCRIENRISESAHCSQTADDETLNLELAKNEMSSSLPVHFGSSESKRKKGEVLEGTYGSLVVNWVPAAREFDTDELDDDWLFGSKKQDHDHRAERWSCRDSSDVLGSRGSSFYLRAHFLPEAGVYAFPYAVPF